MLEEEQVLVEDECTHRWMIESPNGPTSMGRCLVCGSESEFKNSMPISGWDRDGSKAKKSNASGTTTDTASTETKPKSS